MTFTVPSGGSYPQISVLRNNDPLVRLPLYRDNDKTLIVSEWQRDFADTLYDEKLSRPLLQKGNYEHDPLGWIHAQEVALDYPGPASERIIDSQNIFRRAMHVEKGGIRRGSTLEHENRYRTFKEVVSVCRRYREHIYANDSLAGLMFGRGNPRLFAQLEEQTLRHSREARDARGGTAGANIISYSDENFLTKLNETCERFDESLIAYNKAYSRLDFSSSVARTDPAIEITSKKVPIISTIAHYIQLEETRLGRVLEDQLPYVPPIRTPFLSRYG